MRISSTFFPHKRIHKQTWMSPNGTTKNQIDHVAIDNIIKHWIQDVRSYRGVGAHSDHFLVKTTLRLKLPRQWTQKPKDKTKLNIENMKKESIVRKYKQIMMTKLNTVEQSQDVQRKWENLRTIIKTTAEETIGLEPRRRQNKWFNDNCKKAIEDRDKARIEVLRSNTEEKLQIWAQKHRACKQIIRREKRIWKEQKIKTIEEKYMNSCTFFGITNELTKKRKPRTMIMKDSNNVLITEEKKIAGEFREAFKQLLGKTVDTTEESIT